MIEATMASAPESAKALKATLRQAFPATMFRVRLSRGTGYGHCHVEWTDGPSVKVVDPIADRFAGEGFDGRDDSTYGRDGRLPDGRESGLRLVLTQRAISAGFARRLLAQVADFYGVPDADRPQVLVKFGRASGKEYWELSSDRCVPGTTDSWSTLMHRAAQDRTSFSVEG